MRVTTFYSCLAHWCVRAVAVLFITGIAATPSSALTDLYELSQSIGSPMDMSGATQIYSNSSLVASSPRSIGFTFNFDGRNYTTFSVNTSGAMSLGTTTQRYYYPYYFPNYVSTGSTYDLGDKYPFLAVYWLYVGYPMSGGGVYSKVSGTAPRRVLTVEWRNVYTGGGTNYNGGTFQARLYEGSNKIEYWYDVSAGTYDYYYASIGLVSSSTRWINVWGNDINEHYTYPSGGYYFYRYTEDYPITRNRVFSFSPCESGLKMTGDPSQGGTEEMKDGDDLISGTSTQRGSSESFFPFSLESSEQACGPVRYSATFSGPAAADYQLIPGTIDLGEKASPELVFTPQGVGERKAVMTLRLDNGEKYSYDLAATGLTRIDWIADINEGGIAGMPSGGTLLSNVEVDRNEVRDLMPFTIDNTNPDASQFPADIVYILDDPLDEYSLAVPNGTVTGGAMQQIGRVSIGRGGSSTPIITFSPHPDGTKYGTGPQEATLTVIADGESRTYTLSGFAVAPALEIAIEGVDAIESDRNFFRGTVSCVGEVATVLEVTLTNTNRTDVVCDEFAIYAVDSRIQQGTPKYPQALDDFGNMVRSDDYVLSMAPGIAPASDNPRVRFPLTIAPGESQTYYLTYVGQRPGKRYARAFLRTNAVNFFAPDVDNFMPGATTTSEDVEGLMTMEFYGRSIGSRLARDMKGELDGLALVFDPVKVGQSAEAETTVYNTGECDLRIGVDQARLSAGDAGDFELLEVFGGATQVGQDYVIAPGMMATVKARFTPSRSGSRRATLMMATNDSTLGGGITAARGVYYLNLYGVGKAELQARDVVLDPAVIDGPGSEGVVRLENTSSEVINVTAAALEGADIAEITPSPSNPWPSLPVQMQPGDVLEFGVALNPAPGSQPSVKNVEMVFTYGGGDQVRASVEGLTGTRMLVATPVSLFDGLEIPAGTVARRATVLSNQGTFPVTIDDIRVEGPGAVDYQATLSKRRVIDAGGFEIIEVVYAPTSGGNPGATLVIDNNGTGGPLSVALNGSAMGTSPGGESASGSNYSITGSSSRASTGSFSLQLGQIAPNPVRQKMTLSYTAEVGGDLHLGLYNVRGEEVLEVVNGPVPAGAHTAEIDLGSVASGTYIYRLEQNGSVVTRLVMVVN